MANRVSFCQSSLSSKNKKPEKNRENKELSEETLRLLKILEKENWEIKNFLVRSYKALPVSPESKKKFYDYFISHSAFSVATTANPATSIITELLYDGEKLNLSSPIDEYFLLSKAGRSIKERLKVVKEELPKVIEEYRQKRKDRKVLIGNLGSGPGRDVIEVLAAHYSNTSDVRAIHIDKDEFALERGKLMAQVKKVGHLIEFIKGNFLKYNPSKKFDIVLLIGILCSLDFETCVVILKKVKKILKKDGCLIASNVSKKMFEEDPFTYHLMRLGKWKMVFKDEQELKEIFRKAGYEVKRYFTDSYGFHIMCVGTPRSYF
jgi:SAM-dependent methyltransferase